jgi:hypothetical protein
MSDVPAFSTLYLLSPDQSLCDFAYFSMIEKGSAGIFLPHILSVCMPSFPLSYSDVMIIMMLLLLK